MLNLAIVDDEVSMIDTLESYICKFLTGKNIPYAITRFSDGSELLENYRGSFDCIFLDIEMKETDGLKAAAKVREVDPDTVLIFVTQMAQFAMNGYQVDALDYIVKPIEYFQFELVLRRLVKTLSARQSSRITLSNAKGEYYVHTRDILYVEVNGHYLTYHLSGREIQVKETLAQSEAKLSGTPFIRANRYCLVNIPLITSISRTSLTLGHTGSLTTDSQSITLPISRGQRPAVMKAIADYAGGQI